MAGATKEAAKAQWERDVFIAFARTSGLNISIDSITSCKPPLPDIACNIDGSTHFFELAEVVPQEHARALSDKKHYTTTSSDPSSPAAMLRILHQKQQKTYEDASPIDLLLYFNKDFPMYLSDVAIEGEQPSDVEVAARACTASGPFTRVWTYCTWTDQAKRLA